MPTSMSAVIPVKSPADTGVSVVCHPERRRMVLAVQCGHRLSTLEFDATGWRALHAALGFPPSSLEPEPAVTPKSPFHCPKCGKLKLTRSGLPHACKGGQS